MEFWIGLSVGMHLGSVLAGYLEKFGIAYGLLSEEAGKEIDEIEKTTLDVGKIIGMVAED